MMLMNIDPEGSAWVCSSCMVYLETHQTVITVDFSERKRRLGSDCYPTSMQSSGLDKNGVSPRCIKCVFGFLIFKEGPRVVFVGEAVLVKCG